VSPEELSRVVAGYAADKKAQDILELDLRGVLGYTDAFLICTGNTERQTKAIHDGILEGIDVIVHVFTPDARAFYRLEHLWGEAPARAVGA